MDFNSLLNAASQLKDKAEKLTSTPEGKEMLSKGAEYIGTAKKAVSGAKSSLPNDTLKKAADKVESALGGLSKGASLLDSLKK
jgi:hypothetical protein